MGLWTDSARKARAEPYVDSSLSDAAQPADLPTPGRADATPSPTLVHSIALPLRGLLGWPVPSSLAANPEEARARVQLPEFDELLLEKARVISGRIPFAEAEYRTLRRTDPAPDEPEIP